MTYVQDLQAWLMKGLKAELLRKHPHIMAAFQLAPPASDDEAISRFAKATFNFPLMQPWNDLIAGLVALRLGLEELGFVSSSLRTAPDGRAAWFFQEITPLVASSCLERLEYVIRRMFRGRLIGKSEADSLLAELAAAREKPSFAPLRHYVAHGPHLGLGKGGWLETPGQQRLWELAALNDEDGSGVMESLLETDIPRRDRRYAMIGPFVKAVEAFVEATCRRLLALTRQDDAKA